MAPASNAPISFADLRVASVQPEHGTTAWGTAHTAKLVITRAGDASPIITLENQATGSSLMQCVLSARTAWRAGASLFFVSPLPGGAGGMLYAVQCPSKVAAESLQAALDSAVAGTTAAAPAAADGHPNAAVGAGVLHGNGDASRAAAAPGMSTGGGSHSGCQPGSSPLVAAAGQALAQGPGAVGAGARPPASPLLPLPPSPGAPGTAAVMAPPLVSEGPGGGDGGAGPGPPRSPYHPGLGLPTTTAAAVTASPSQSQQQAQQQQLVQQQHQQSHSACHPHPQQQQQQQVYDRISNGGAAAVAAPPVSTPPPAAAAGSGGGGSNALNHFDRKICRASADMYFHYYGMLQHQQNMLQDYTRTGTYYQAIVGNPDDFRGRVVMDVGAGSGILSLFAAQAGAARVYAVEASGMARFARQLADANPALGARITVINSKVEEVTLPERVDVLVSEPMGTLLVNERMLESYIYARDAFLKPGGKMFPQLGRVHAAAFSDEVLHAEVAAKSAFWLQPAFYGVDVTALHAAATEGYFGQVVVDAFDPSHLVSSCATRPLDFGTMPESELLEIDMPLNLVTGPVAPVTIHGIACWFDVFFAGAQQPVWLTTAPGMPTTHWFQLRCVLQQPLVVAVPNTRLTGRLHLVAHARQSYDIYLTLTAPPVQPGHQPQTSSGKFDLKEPYYRQLTSYGVAAAAAVSGQGDGMEAGAAAGAGAGAGAGWGW